MGYRSDVAYTITFRDKATLNEFIALVMLKGEVERKALGECQIVVDADKFCEVNFYNQSVKWYDSYPEVVAHEWLLDFAAERFEPNAAYRFIRIGEELEDNEDKYGGVDELIDWDLGISRSIYIPFNEHYEPVGDRLALIP